jgi:hypothetical protein
MPEGHVNEADAGGLTGAGGLAAADWARSWARKVSKSTRAAMLYRTFPVKEGVLSPVLGPGAEANPMEISKDRPSRPLISAFDPRERVRYITLRHGH